MNNKSLIVISVISALTACEKSDPAQQFAQECAENYINNVAAELDASVISVKATNIRKVPGKDLLIHDIQSELFDNKKNSVINLPKNDFQCYTSQEEFKKYQEQEKQISFNKIYTWKTDYYQSSFENNNVTVDLFDNHGEALPRFMVPSKSCKINDNFQDIEITVNNNKYDYKYLCSATSSPKLQQVSPKVLIYLGKGLSEIARTGNNFNVSEKYAQDVKVKILDQVYTFDAAGYGNAYKEMTKYYKSQ